MAFPSVIGTPTTGTTASNTSHVITLPSGIVAGELLVVLFGCGVASTITWGAFTGMPPSAQTATLGTTTLGLGYKIAVGGDTLTVTTSNSGKGAYVACRITDWHGTTAPEGDLVGNAAAGDPNPGPWDATWGTEDTLWLAGGAVEGSTGWTSDAPASYTNIGDINTTGGSGPSNVAVALAWRKLAVTSEEPGPFDAVTDDEWLAGTVAVRPVAIVLSTFPFNPIPFYTPKGKSL
jgi:hypothetical protein